MPTCTKCRKWEKWEGGPIDEDTGEFLNPTILVQHVDRCADCRGLPNIIQTNAARKQLMAAMSTIARRAK